MLTEDIIPSLQGAMPSPLATVDDNGVPNISYISQVFYVDDSHVALSNQFFNKSMRNIKANGIATVNVVRPDDLSSWYLSLQLYEWYMTRIVSGLGGMMSIESRSWGLLWFMSGRQKAGDGRRKTASPSASLWRQKSEDGRGKFEAKSSKFRLQQAFPSLLN